MGHTAIGGEGQSQLKVEARRVPHFQYSNIQEPDFQFTILCLQRREKAKGKQTEVFFVLGKCSAVQCAAVSADTIRTKSFEINYITVLQGKEKGEINFREHFLSGKGDNAERLHCLGFCTD